MDSYMSQATTLTGRHDAGVPRLRLLRTPVTSSSATTQKSPEEVQLPSSPTSSSSPTPSNRRRTSNDNLTSNAARVAGASSSSSQFQQQARSSILSTSSSSDSPAARLRAITERVTSNPNLSLSTSTSRPAHPASRTSPFPLPPDLSRGFISTTGHASTEAPYQYFDTESEAGTVVIPANRNAPQQYGSARDRKISIPSDLESDVESMAAHAAQMAVASSSRAHLAGQNNRLEGSSIGETSDTSGVDKLNAFWAKIKAQEDTGGESQSAQDIKNKYKAPAAGLGLRNGQASSSSKPGQRIRTSSLTKQSTSNDTGTPLRGAVGRVSLSDEETERNIRTPARPTDFRRRATTTPSVDALRAHLNSQEYMNDDSILNTPAQPPPPKHPLHVMLENADLSAELPNPTPPRGLSRIPATSLSFSNPRHTSTPRTQNPNATVDMSLGNSTTSSAALSPFRAPPTGTTAYTKSALQQQHGPPGSPTPISRSRGPSPIPGSAPDAFPIVAKRKRMSMAYNPSFSAAGASGTSLRVSGSGSPDQPAEERQDDEESLLDEETPENMYGVGNDSSPMTSLVQAAPGRRGDAGPGSRSAPISIASTSMSASNPVYESASASTVAPPTTRRRNGPIDLPAKPYAPSVTTNTASEWDGDADVDDYDSESVAGAFQPNGNGNGNGLPLRTGPRSYTAPGSSTRFDGPDTDDDYLMENSVPAPTSIKSLAAPRAI